MDLFSACTLVTRIAMEQMTGIPCDHLLSNSRVLILSQRDLSSALSISERSPTKVIFPGIVHINRGMMIRNLTLLEMVIIYLRSIQLREIKIVTISVILECFKFISI